MLLFFRLITIIMIALNAYGVYSGNPNIVGLGYWLIIIFTLINVGIMTALFLMWGFLLTDRPDTLKPAEGLVEKLNIERNKSLVGKISVFLNRGLLFSSIVLTAYVGAYWLATFSLLAVALSYLMIPSIENKAKEIVNKKSVNKGYYHE